MLLASSQLLVPLLPIWAGISFATIGIAYQMAQHRKVTPLRAFSLLSLCGTAFFAIKCIAGGTFSLSPRALALGIAAGLSQYINIKLVGRAITLGPFSLVWCVLSLTFMPVILYAAFMQNEPQLWNQWLAVAVAVACCILATVGHDPEPTATSSRASRAQAVFAYGLLLVAILFANALLNVCIQDLNVAAPNQSRDPFFLLMYASIAIATMIDAIAAREFVLTIRRAWLPGLLAGLGSTSGMLSINAASARTGPGAFLICSMVSLILPMLAAVFAFRERITARWIGTLILGLAAIVLANLDLLKELLYA